MQLVEDDARRMLSVRPKIGVAPRLATASKCATMPAYALAPAHSIVSTEPSRRSTVTMLLSAGRQRGGRDVEKAVAADRAICLRSGASNDTSNDELNALPQSIQPAHDHVDTESLRVAVAASADRIAAGDQQERRDAVDADVEQRTGAARVDAVVASAHVHRGS
jgi:hypothetical protein